MKYRYIKLCFHLLYCVGKTGLRYEKRLRGFAHGSLVGSGNGVFKLL
jgi:hypothetical protein